MSENNVCYLNPTPSGPICALYLWRMLYSSGSPTIMTPCGPWVSQRIVCVIWIPPPLDLYVPCICGECSSLFYLDCFPYQFLMPDYAHRCQTITLISWHITLDISFLIRHSCNIVIDISLLTCKSLFFNSNLLLLPCYHWFVTLDVTLDMSLLTCHSWHVTLALSVLTCHETVHDPTRPF